MLQNVHADTLQTHELHCQQPWNWFSLWRLLQSCVSYKFSILHSYFHCKPFLSKLQSGIK